MIMAKEIKGPSWIYTIPPKTRITVKDEKGIIRFQYTNDTFYIKWLETPFYVRPTWIIIEEKI